MDRFYDGYEEWREEMASSDDYVEQRKANYVPEEMRHEQALEFIERESYQGGAFAMLMRVAMKRASEGRLVNTEFEVKSIKRNLEENMGYTAKEVKAMFKGATSSQMAAISREMIIREPALADYIRIRKCQMSKFYPELQYLEGSAAIDTESGGDFVA